MQLCPFPLKLQDSGLLQVWMFIFSIYCIIHQTSNLSLDVDLMFSCSLKGSSDGTVRLWEVETCRCIKVWEFGEIVQYVAWNPLPELPILAVTV